MYRAIPHPGGYRVVDADNYPINFFPVENELHHIDVQRQASAYAARLTARLPKSMRMAARPSAPAPAIAPRNQTGIRVLQVLAATIRALCL